MPYDANGDQYDARDVLDAEEFASYRRRRAEDAHHRLARFSRTGILPPAIRENTEERAVDAYEAWVMGA